MRLNFIREEPIALEKRAISHYSHIMDNSNEGRYYTLFARKNSFLVREFGNGAYLSQPFENVLEDRLEEIVSFLLEDIPEINLVGFRDDQITDNLSVEVRQSCTRIYQSPLASEDYSGMLKKFAKSGYKARQLGESDAGYIVKLQGQWISMKIKKSQEELKRLAELDDLNEKERLECEGRKLKALHSELSLLTTCFHDEDHYIKRINQRLNRFFGAFHEGELVAYCQVEGNSHLTVFDSRASIRMPKSPQEFLDLNVANLLVKEGVVLFDRGYNNQRTWGKSLLEYKRRFGPLSLKKEADYFNIVPVESVTI